MLAWVAGGGYLLALCFFELIPHLFQSPTLSPLSASIWIMLGFLIQQALAPLTKGMEHAHPISSPSTAEIPHALLPALCMHAWLEGTILNPAHEHAAWARVVGIALHKLPVAYVLALALHRTPWRPYAIALFALMTPMGAWTLYLCKQQPWLSQITQPLYAIASGSLLHVATTILLESAPAHQYRHQQWRALVIGILVAALLCLGVHA